MTSRDERGLVGALYDAALGYRSWIEVGQALMRHVDGQTLMLSTHQARTGQVDVLGWLGMPAESLPQYAEFAPHDVWASGFVEQRLFGRAVVGSSVVQEQALTRSLIYNDYLRPKVGIFHLVGTVLPMEGGHQAVLGIHRPRDAKDYVADDARRLGRLLPHLQRALEVRRRLQQAEQARHSIHAVLDRLSLGVIMLAASGRLLHVNAAADAILRGDDGLTRTPDGLRAANREDDRRLQELIGALRQAGSESRSAGGHLRVRRPSGRQAYAVMLAPVGPSVMGEQNMPAILVFVSDPGQKIASDLAVLSELFGFTPAEGRLVLALLAGMAPPEFARQTGVTYNTVKTLLGRAMARTESRSQLELVLLVAGAIGGVVPATASKG